MTRNNGEFPIDGALARVQRLRRGVITAARQHIEATTDAPGSFRWRQAMITCTYRPEAVWEQRDITKLMKNIRDHLSRRGIPFRFVWVMELTKAGNPHYHVLLWLPSKVRLPKPDNQGWWVKGSTEIAWARKPIGYLVKYVSKMKTAASSSSRDWAFPPAARIHGSGGLSTTGRMVSRWWQLPSWARKAFPDYRLDVRRAECGGIVARASGELRASPYVVTMERTGIVAKLKDALGLPEWPVQVSPVVECKAPPTLYPVRDYWDALADQERNVESRWGWINQTACISRTIYIPAPA